MYKPNKYVLVIEQDFRVVFLGVNIDYGLFSVSFLFAFNCVFFSNTESDSNGSALLHRVERSGKVNKAAMGRHKKSKNKSKHK